MLYAVTFFNCRLVQYALCQGCSSFRHDCYRYKDSWVSFLFGFTTASTSFYFTSIGRARESAVISSARGTCSVVDRDNHTSVLLRDDRCVDGCPVTEILSMIVSIYYVTGDEQRNI